MRYCYTSFNSEGQRLDITTRIEEFDSSIFSVGGWVEVSDNAYPDREGIVFKGKDDLDEWYDHACRVAQWSDASAKQAIRERLKKNGFHVKTTECRDPEEVKEHLTLGQLKLEDNNVKTAAAAKKPRMAAVPPIAIMALGAAMQTGADKYGLFNWRDTSVTATVFYNAMVRHLEQWYSGEQCASDTGVHHLAHLMAGAAIILDAEMNEVFKDDRPKGKILGDDYAKYFMKVPDAS